MATAARADVNRQKRIDEQWEDRQATLRARMQAVLGAQAALARHEPNAPFVLRQSLVDLASVSELLAEELPRPTVR